MNSGTSKSNNKENVFSCYLFEFKEQWHIIGPLTAHDAAMPLKCRQRSDILLLAGFCQLYQSKIMVNSIYYLTCFPNINKSARNDSSQKKSDRNDCPYEVGSKPPAPTGPKRPTPEFGPKRPDRTGIGPKRPRFHFDAYRE